MVHNYPETLGDVIKEARQRAERTMKELAISVGITERYLYRIENEGKKPSFDVLYKLIRELSITSGSIFYPEKPTKDSEIENLIRLLYNCDERSLEVIKATAKALIDTDKGNRYGGIAKKRKPIKRGFHDSSALRLYASSSVTIFILKLLISIKLSLLHLGQYRGKFLICVSSRTLIRVLFLQIGHNIHSTFFIVLFNHYNFPSFFKP